MSERSIESSFQLLSFKMDRIDFTVVPSLNVLAFNTPAEIKNNDYQISFRNPFRFKDGEKNLYVSGINIKICLKDNSGLEIANGNFIITGLFSAEKFKDMKTEEQLAKYQAPTILFPYIRSCITGVLANAGFGSIILPLVNMQTVASSIELKIEDKGPARKITDSK